MHELTLAEAAYLAALPKGPNNYNPFRYPDRAIERRNWVIDRMVENGYVTAAEGEAAKDEPLGVKLRTTGAVASSPPTISPRKCAASSARCSARRRSTRAACRCAPRSTRRLQVMARQALMDGLVNYDSERGWRGPVAHIDDLGDDWGTPVAEVAAALRRHRMAAGGGAVAVDAGSGDDRPPALNATRAPARSLPSATPARSRSSR